MPRVRAALAALAACCLLGASALAQNKAVKIGVLDDMSGPYAENTGPGDVAAAKFAIADFGGSVLGKPIELVSADFQSKVDVGLSEFEKLAEAGVSAFISSCSAGSAWRSAWLYPKLNRRPVFFHQ